MATLAHPTANEFSKPRDTSAMRAALERAVDAAPRHVRPPRGRLRRLFARDRSARALIGRYRLWSAIEHAWARVTREYGPMRVEISADSDGDDTYVVVNFFGSVPINDELHEFESAVFHEIMGLLPGKRFRHLHVEVWPEREPRREPNELRS
ncbi:hypothetical protein [Longimicrobium sp.]|uniref:hypothetical protein n=1 Tax=Longimicrobium sp. TaxID=2029185 RepID=UPI002BF425CA|nr:hypothetical protein [Longimicrobium sp.]HSU16888.1 hypothetical protein [Longimicrobium sp.]